MIPFRGISKGTVHTKKNLAYASTYCDLSITDGGSIVSTDSTTIRVLSGGLFVIKATATTSSGSDTINLHCEVNGVVVSSYSAHNFTTIFAVNVNPNDLIRVRINNNHSSQLITVNGNFCVVSNLTL